MSDLLNAIEPWVELWAASVWRASWQGALVLSIAWTVARWCTFISPRVICWVWRLAYLKLLLVIFWAVPLNIPLLPSGSAESAIASNVKGELPTLSASEPKSGAVAITEPLRHSDRRPPGMHRGSALLLMVWLFGVGCCGYATLRQWRTVRKLRASSQVFCGDLIEAALREESDRLGVRRAPELRQSPMVRGPLVAGILRPAIILPGTIEGQFTAAEVRLVIFHELAHVRRGDLAWNWLLVVSRALFFFHPLVWLTTGCWAEAQEAACDELLIQKDVASLSAYGSLLVKLCTSSPLCSGTVLATAGMSGSFRNLQRRLLTMSHVRPRSPVRLLVSAGLMALVGVAGLVPYRLVARAQDNPEDKQLLAIWETMSQEEVDARVLDNFSGLVRAAHAYYKDHRVLPPAVVPNPDLPPEKRLSGFVLLLPYIDKATRLLHGKEIGRLFDEKTCAMAKELSRSIDLKKAWDDPMNLQAARTLFSPLLVPRTAAIRDKSGFAVSHVAFVRGADGKDDGAFTDDATVTILGDNNAITDGTSGTLALGQISTELGPWTAAGAGTSRWLFHAGQHPTKPSFGTQQRNLIYVANCDGSPYVLDLKATPASKLVKLVTKSASDIYEWSDIVRYRSMAEARQRQ